MAGDATSRLTIGDMVMFLDTYMDRVPAAVPVAVPVGPGRRTAAALLGSMDVAESRSRIQV